MISFQNLTSNKASQKQWCEEDRERSSHRLHDQINLHRATEQKQVGGVIERKISAPAGDPYLTPICRLLLHTSFPPSCSIPSHSHLSLAQQPRLDQIRQKSARRSSRNKRHASAACKNGDPHFLLQQETIWS